MKKFAIIGFGAAGYHGAKAVRRLDPEAVVDVYSDTWKGPHNPMLTTYYVKGAIPYEAMFPFGSLEEVCRELDLHYHGECPAVRLDAGEKCLYLADGNRVRYDGILVSTGASALIPAFPGRDLPGVCTMRTEQDAVRLKNLLDSGQVKHGIVIGASWVGIKVVEDLVERGAGCTLVEGADRVFAAAAFPETADRVRKGLEDRGIQVCCGEMLAAIEKEPDGRLTAVMKSGNRYTGDLAVLCMGVRMNVGFLRDSGLALNRGLLVDERMRTSCPGIYGAGDCCEAYELQSGRQRNIGLWHNAARQGQVAGTNMAGGFARFGGNILVNLAHYLDCDFVSIGDPGACGDQDEVYEYEDARYYIRALRGRETGTVKCINVTGSGISNGVLRNLFVKSLENPEARMDIQTWCFLGKQGFPREFIMWLGGKRA